MKVERLEEESTPAASRSCSKTSSRGVAPGEIDRRTPEMDGGHALEPNEHVNTIEAVTRDAREEGGTADSQGGGSGLAIERARSTSCPVRSASSSRRWRSRCSLPADAAVARFARYQWCRRMHAGRRDRQHRSLPQRWPARRLSRPSPHSRVAAGRASRRHTARNPANDQAQTPALRRPRHGPAGTAQAGTVGHTQP